MRLKLIYNFIVLLLLVGAIYYALYIKDNTHRQAIESLSKNNTPEVVEKIIKKLEKIDRGFYGTILIIALLLFINQSDRFNFDERIKRLETKAGIANTKKSQPLLASSSSLNGEKDSNEKVPKKRNPS